MNLNMMAAECHAANQHWWHDPATGARLDRNKGKLCMLVVSEIAEAMEGERKGLNDDKLPHRPMAEVEMADVMIRVFDLAGAYDLDLDYAISKIKFDPLAGLEDRGHMLFRLTAIMVLAGQSLLVDDRVNAAMSFAVLITGVMRYCTTCGYDLEGAIAEKRAYNAVRADHKAEARLAAGGKKW